jgi:hypothetical protein
MAYDAMGGDQFGCALAMTDSTLAVGAYSADINGIDGQGAVYVFTRSGAAWTFQQKITAADGATFDYFGTDVALDGDTVAIGAKYAKIGTNEDQGAAYVFRRYSVTWQFEKKLTAFDGAADDYFGGGIALSGNTVVVGAKRKQIGTNGHQGAAYVYTRSGSVWTFQQRLTANDGASNDYFGHAVALLGDMAVVSAHFANLGAGYDQGAIYVFTRSGTLRRRLRLRHRALFVPHAPAGQSAQWLPWRCVPIFSARQRRRGAVSVRAGRRRAAVRLVADVQWKAGGDADGAGHV